MPCPLLQLSGQGVGHFFRCALPINFRRPLPMAKVFVGASQPFSHGDLVNLDLESFR